MFKIFYSATFSVSEDFLNQYLYLRDQAETEKTHFFEKRYENIAIQRRNFPEIEPLLIEAQTLAKQILGLGRLPDVGFWFNEMHHGHRTLPHRHDEDDELLSAVFYLSVPEHSGDLLLGKGETLERVKPSVGMFVFFAPSLIHEVEQNKSSEMRLSIGMNFGLRESSDSN